ncbi:antibiotic biosynthesis monooxygenase [Actinomycetospora endophytica]|uniref:Antibiotic biosynthesis monooxygenase n=1 Tax=Actinomycetospora endophytica TaxID=2291215 RepID=A0ABS8P774_9PSEU|nr:antibiotic biosynthesis monooxygenase family protein [Actinomycetospora endophytica]MCD2194093.1 antibiotic biosynthesis monooxygenase [Actinomycetospora endophytica]
MTTPEPDDGPVTFLNIFEIPREDVGAFRAGWVERIRLVEGAPGFRGAHLLEALSDDERFQLVNVTQWDSRAAQEAATGGPQLRASVADARADQRQRVTPNPGFYRVAATATPDRP